MTERQKFVWAATFSQVFERSMLGLEVCTDDAEREEYERRASEIAHARANRAARWATGPA